jgi:cytochrome c-type biogenesis protein CcmH/NrfG
MSPAGMISLLLYLLMPIVFILSTVFSPSISNAIFGKYISSSNLVYFSSLILSVYIISAYIKNGYKNRTWLIIMMSSLLLTIPVILAIILLRFNLTNIAPYFTYLVSSWDVLATISALVVIISLVYYETIAISSKQRLISLILIILHLALIALMIIPDIWQAIALSSFGILLISFLRKEHNHKKIYNRLSFFIFIIALFFSIIFSLANSWSKATAFTQGVANFSAKYTGINYSFVKPRLNLSLKIGAANLKKGKIFGAGLNEFNSVWQKEKPQAILESAYWNTEFISSYSTMTTLFVTVGVFGVLAIITIICALVYAVVKDLKRKDGNSNLDLDEENKFYFLSSIALFIFSTALLFLFVNTGLSILIFALSSALLASHITNWRAIKILESGYLLFFVVLLIVLSGTIVNMNRVRATNIVSSASNNFQKDNDFDKFEKALLKAARVSNDDINYRLLTQFYLSRTQQLISASSTDTADLQKKVLTSLNSAITASKAAINIDPRDYNNYMSLGSVYTFSMELDKQNKESYYKNAKDIYTEALKYYPKNPSIPLTIAQLNYSYSKDATSTIVDVKKSLEIKPNYSDAFYTLSQLSSQNNDRASALNYAVQAIQSDQTNENAYMQLGILSLSSKEPTKDDLSNAYLAFSTVLQGNPNNVTAAYYLTITFTLAKDYASAKSLLDSLLKALPEEEKIKELQAFVANQEKNFPDEVATPESQ